MIVGIHIPIMSMRVAAHTKIDTVRDVSVSVIVRRSWSEQLNMFQHKIYSLGVRCTDPKVLDDLFIMRYFQSWISEGYYKVEYLNQVIFSKIRQQ